MPLPVIDFQKTDPLDSLKPWEPSPAEPWDRARAAHLFRRAGFGATPAEIDRALADGYHKTLDRVLTGEPDAIDLLELLTEAGKLLDDPSKLRVWWVAAMLDYGHPLREKLTLFWHNHFATSYAKVRSTKLICEQNVTLRKHALGKFRPFLLDMSRDAAMLVWLDSNRNVKAAPNENFAREVMELFSLGVGNYTEKDVQEAARAFTGWHHDAEASAFEFSPGAHDDGQKTLFGKTGRWKGDDVVRLCCDHDACPRFLAGKLYSFLVSETRPPERVLAALAARLRSTDYAIDDFVKMLLGSRLFYSDHAYRKRVKWPVEYVLGAVRGLCPGRVPYGELVDPLARMGQVLFAPPNVKGWRTGTDWLNSATLLARNNFAETVALGQWSGGGPPRPQTGVALKALAVPTEPLQAILPTQPGPAPAIPAPPAEHDPVSLVYATKPKDIPAVVRRIGELTLGEPLPPKTAAKLEAFLRRRPEPEAQQELKQPGGYTLPSVYEPGALVPSYIAPPGITDGKSNTIDLTQPVPTFPGIPDVFRPAPVAVAPAPRVAVERPVAVAPAPHEPPPYEWDLQSAEFKARVREALHAAMCMPEYQLN